MIQAKINGVVYQMLSSFSITEKAGNKTTSEIKILLEDQELPLAGDVVEVFDGDDIIFWGTCSIPSTPKYKTGLEMPIITLKCSNANSILSNRLVNSAYQEKTISQIVTDIFIKYIQTEGIALGQISDIPVVMDVYTVKDFNLQDALNELADLVGAVWRVDNDRKFYFVLDQDFKEFPHVIDADYLSFSEIQHTTKSYKTRTVQYISGAQDYTSPQTESFAYDGEQSSFATVFPIANKPLIYVNESQVPPEKIGVNGINTGDSNIVFLFTFNSATLSYVSDTNYLTVGDVVKVEYTGIFPIRIQLANESKISEIAARTGTSGRREVVQLASGFVTQNDAMALAQSLLNQFSEATGEIKFWIHTDQLAMLGLTLEDLSLLTRMTFDLPQIHIAGTYAIVERRITPAYGDMSEGWAGKLKIELCLQNGDYLRSYGETISSLRRDVNALSVREDEIVIAASSVSEPVNLSERVVTAYPWRVYPTSYASGSPPVIPQTLGADFYPDI